MGIFAPALTHRPISPVGLNIAFSELLQGTSLLLNVRRDRRNVPLLPVTQEGAFDAPR